MTLGGRARAALGAGLTRKDTLAARAGDRGEGSIYLNIIHLGLKKTHTHNTFLLLCVHVNTILVKICL